MKANTLNADAILKKYINRGIRLTWKINTYYI